MHFFIVSGKKESFNKPVLVVDMMYLCLLFLVRKFVETLRCYGCQVVAYCGTLLLLK